MKRKRNLQDVTGEEVRQDIFEDQEGVPFALDLQVIDVTSCTPVKDAYVEIWSANSTGVYSGIVSNLNGAGLRDAANLETTFLRGIQKTDEDGAVQFHTLFPGFYTGRAVHVHIMVHVNAEVHENGTIIDQTPSHVGQIYFDQDLITSVRAVAPYSTNQQQFMQNSADYVLRLEPAGSDPFVHYALVGEEAAAGVVGWFTVGIDPVAAREVAAATNRMEGGSKHIFLLVGEAILQFRQSYPAHDGHLDKCNNMLERLPNELWMSVIAQITDRRDLNSLSQVSKTLHDRTIPFLYRDLTVRPLSESDFGDIDVSKLLETNSSERKPLVYTTSFRIVAGFVTRIKRRCMHHDGETWDAEVDIDYDTSDKSHVWASIERAAEHPTLRHLADRVVSLISCFSDGHLRSFTWNLGLCVPARLLGCDGYLTQHQSGIESIRLITDASCPLGDGSLTLDQFKRLKVLSWIGLRAEDEFESLERVLANRAHHLVELELDFLNWKELEVLWEDGLGFDAHPFETLLLEIPCNSARCSFPVLQRLSLSNLDLRSDTQMMASALNSPHLRSLTLRQCPGWSRFVQYLLGDTGQLHFQSLEVQNTLLGDDAVDFNYNEVIQTILESLVGVEDIYLSLWNPRSPRTLWDTLQRHTETLKRFIFQARTSNIYDESETFVAEIDAKNMGIVSPALLGTVFPFGETCEDEGDDEWFNETYPNPLNKLNLECIGLACGPHRLQEVLKPFAEKTCLRILHARQSGADIKRRVSWVFDTKKADAAYFAGQPPGKHVLPGADPFCWASLPGRNNAVTVRVLTRDFLNFATWVFGPNGISSLEILAYGDFSCHGRYLANSFMLRRKKPTEDGQMPWKWHDPERERHFEIEDLLHRHAGFLEACPTDTLLE
ncbi:unnamed protein product [Parascedosporium putredinis]|uniref:Intradiol ring-cleavage dioxygenases domain-containing protein n=1 Tax=Parascedosporium putredinis TaxID=1442378 RepID=A0A9P1GZG4_9PEZI|nr:unnamed protein product [Parascedosporium putredinis]CAI7990781.1 unnamed protein product [Parascedosporium putredinis]